MQLTKERAKENLSKLVKKFERELSAGQIKEYNEEATKTVFIQPLLKDVLGWDVNDRDEVSPEEKISRGRVDYGLKVERKIKIFIEAKPPKADLSKHVEQAVRYGYNRKGVPFVLLTDFEELKLFDVTVKPDTRNPLKGLKIDLRWNQYLLQFEKIWCLSKESLIQGELDKLLLIKPKERISVDKAILDDLKRWSEVLAKDIFKNNRQLFLSGDQEKDANYLKEITQRILDRIIFMRSCEDRGLIYRRPLKELFEERTETVGTNTMIFLKEEFNHYNIIFDSDMFRPQEWEGNLAIDFKVMRDIVLETYNPYQFDVIPLEVLGNIYEQYLGYTIRLTAHQVKYELKPELRKAGGVYYTPEYIVDYIVRNTLGKLLHELPPRKIKKLKILDPACGSGSFLIRAYEEMLNYYRDQKRHKLKSREDQRKLDLKEEEVEPRLTIQEKSEILRNHIFGVDIDEQAVEVTKLSLMLKMLEGEYGIIPGRAILPMLDQNIKCGNSLISGDILELKKYFGDDWYKVKPFNWDEEFAKIMKEEGGFDVVIGNPPYVRVDCIPQFEKIFYLNNFQTAKGKFDNYYLFIEKSLSLLGSNGSFGMIIPNRFCTSDSGTTLRKLILGISNSVFINSVSKLNVFGDARNYPVLLFIHKQKKEGFNKIEFSEASQKDQLNTNVPIILSMKQAEIDRIPAKIFPINASKREVDLLFKASRNSRALATYLIISEGFRIPRILEKNKGDEHIIKQYQFSRYSPIKQGTYINRQDRSKIISDSSERYINCFREKIVIAEDALKIEATIDLSKSLCQGGVYFAVLRPSLNLDINLYFLLGILNSSLHTFIYKLLFSGMHMGGGYLRFRTKFLEQLPIHIIDLSNRSEKKLHDNLVALVDVMLDLNKKIQTAKGSEKEQIQRQIEKTDKEIDDLVYKIYGITEEEKKIIEGKG